MKVKYKATKASQWLSFESGKGGHRKVDPNVKATKISLQLHYVLIEKNSEAKSQCQGHDTIAAASEMELRLDFNLDNPYLFIPQLC